MTSSETEDRRGTRSFLVLNGPNLNLLGTREPEIYGHTTLADIEASLREAAAMYQVEVHFVQSNAEGALIDAIHDARGRHGGIIINPGAYTHTSIAIMDALSGIGLPVVEVHLSNVHRREEFRHRSYVSLVAQAVIAGAGPLGYRYALDLLVATTD